ncbi:hypothetical protein BGX28_000020 [Mortierella sp. GBA30]|nr:hypothetical protein BGX28_000020 [Mortierella sp. GBA30]
MPSGIMAMDLVTDNRNYTTVMTWEKRNADITAYNVFLGSNDSEPQPLRMEGRAQELPSFHSHSQYTSSSSLRNPSKVWNMYKTADGQLQQSVKPPLLGLGVMATSLLAEGEHSEGLELEAVGTETKLSVSRFSLLQYSSTGAVYAQEIEIKTQREITDDEHETMKESILFSDHSHEPGEIDAASENPLTSKLALLASEQEEHDEIQLIDELIAAAEGHVAPWRNRIVEAQRLADEIAVSPAEVHEHVDLDLRALLNSIKALLLRDYETSHINFETGAATLAEEGMGFISKAVAPQSMLDVLQAIKCFNLSIAERESISGMIQQNIEQDPFVTTVGGEIIHRTIVRTWPMLGLKIGTLIRDEVPSIDFIASFLEDVYPLPEKQMLKRDQDALKAQSVTRSLALLSIPQDHQDRSGDKDETTGGSEKEEDEVQEDNEIWPSQEAEQLRKRTIRRLAQELILSTTLIVKTVLPGAESESRTAKNATCAPQFQYLFQNSSLGESSPTIPLSSRCKSVLDEWKVGQNPNEYNYQLPESVAVGQGGSGTEETAEEKKEREERLLRLRQKREKRSNKTLNARKNDPGFNVSAKGSASQPAGLVVMDSEYSFSQYSADDDGFFSLPTVISASQPVVRNTGTGTGLGLSQAKSTPQPVLKKHATAFGVSASQPSSTASSSKKPLARKAERTSLGFGSQQPLSLDSAMLQPIAELSASQSESQSLSQEQDQDQSQSQSQSQEGTGLLWGASQPVPGPFANRKIAKPKKAKAKRVQGF